MQNNTLEMCITIFEEKEKNTLQSLSRVMPKVKFKYNVKRDKSETIVFSCTQNPVGTVINFQNN